MFIYPGEFVRKVSIGIHNTQISIFFRIVFINLTKKKKNVAGM